MLYVSIPSCHMPHAFWKAFADRVRAEHPGLFMFGERFEFEAEKLAEHMKLENGDISVLDFVGQRAITKVFQEPQSDFAELQDYLHLTDGVYDNPYKLAIFYDNHDMTRMKASDNGFIDANNWLFTSRGFPVIYYGSEVGFMAGSAEHAGNRNYFGPERIAAAESHPIRTHLQRIANIRKATPALQRGLQLNLLFDGQRAAFLRVLQKDGINQTALVLLNKGDTAAQFELTDSIETGQWRDATTGQIQHVTDKLLTKVGPHGVKILIRDAVVADPGLTRALRIAQAGIPRV